MLAFALSLDDFIITLFNAGNQRHLPALRLRRPARRLPAADQRAGHRDPAAEPAGARRHGAVAAAHAAPAGDERHAARLTPVPPMQPIEQACYWLARRAPRGHTPARRARRTPTSRSSAPGSPASGRRCSSRSSSRPGGGRRRAGPRGLRRERAQRRACCRRRSTTATASRSSTSARPRRAGWRALGERNVAEMTAFLAERGHPLRLRAHRAADGRADAGARRTRRERTVETARRLGLDELSPARPGRGAGGGALPLYLGGVCGDGRRASSTRSSWSTGFGREAERLGVRVFERSPVTGVEPAGAGDAGPRGGGQRRAPGASCWRRAPTPTTCCPRVTHRFIPLYDYILVSDPLTAAQREAIGWRRRQGVTDGRTFFNYYRLTADDRILWGTSEAAYYAGNRVDPVVRSLAGPLRRAPGELPAPLSRRSAGSSFRMRGAGRSARPRG